MKELNKGDKIAVLDDVMEGVVVGFKNDEVIIETTDGFELFFKANELIKIGDTSEINRASRYSDIEEAKAEKVIKNHHKINSEKKSRKEEFVLEVDLHIEKLVKSFKHMTNFDILNLQVDTARSQLEFAIKNRIPKIVFIHGMGEGVLKTELDYLFGRYTEVSYQDANYRKYGLGATEVFLKQSALI
nr:Smr/MutS family protein [uncultured Flavobacterium sp.]